MILRPTAARSRERSRFIVINALCVTRQGFYWYLNHRDDPWKYEGLAEKMRGIVTEDDYNDTYGRCRKCKGVLTIPIKVSDTQQWTMKLHNDGKGYSTITSVRGIVKPAF